jgi:hypothetical protein
MKQEWYKNEDIFKKAKDNSFKGRSICDTKNEPVSWLKLRRDVFHSE